MNQVFTIAKKELIEIFRSKVSLTILLIPILIIPLFNIGIKYFNSNNQTATNIAIQSSNPKALEVLKDYIQDNSSIRIMSPENTINSLNNGEIMVLIDVTDVGYDFIYNSSSYLSMSCATKLGEEFEKYYYTELQKSMEIYDFRLLDETRESASASSSISYIFIPIMLVVLTLQCTSTFVNNAFAGEKDRKTLELLLLSGVRRSKIYFGKFIALLCFSVANIVISLFICFLSGELWSMGTLKFLYVGNCLLNSIIIIVSLFMLSFLTITIETAVSIVAKHMKDAQMINELVLAIPLCCVVVISLGMISTNDIWVYLIPVLNLISCFCGAFSGIVNLGYVLVSISIDIFLIAVFQIFGIRYLSSEKVVA